MRRLGEEAENRCQQWRKVRCQEQIPAPVLPPVQRKVSAALNTRMPAMGRNAAHGPGKTAVRGDSCQSHPAACEPLRFIGLLFIGRCLGHIVPLQQSGAPRANSRPFPP